MFYPLLACLGLHKYGTGFAPQCLRFDDTGSSGIPAAQSSWLGLRTSLRLALERIRRLLHAVYSAELTVSGSGASKRGLKWLAYAPRVGRSQHTRRSQHTHATRSPKPVATAGQTNDKSRYRVHDNTSAQSQIYTGASNISTRSREWRRCSEAWQARFWPAAQLGHVLFSCCSFA